MKYYIWVSVIIIIILIVVIGFLGYTNYNIAQKNKVFTAQLKEAEQKRNDNIITKTVTITVFKTLPDAEKEQKYSDALKIISDDTDIISAKDKKLSTLNEAFLKAKKNVIIQGFASAGITQSFDFQFHEGLIISKIFKNTFLIGGGVAVNQTLYYNNLQTKWGGDLIFSLGVML